MSDKTYVLNTGPSFGTLTEFNSDGTYKYAPNPCYYGNDSFTVDVICEEAVQSTETITIAVSGSAYPIYSSTGKYICSGGVSLEEFLDENKCSGTYGEKTFMASDQECGCDAKVKLEVTGGQMPYNFIATTGDDTKNRVTCIKNNGNGEYELHIELVKDTQKHTYNIVVTDVNGNIAGTACLNSFQCCGDFDISPSVIMNHETSDGTIAAFIAQEDATVSIKIVGDGIERFVSYDSDAYELNYTPLADANYHTYEVIVSHPGMNDTVRYFTSSVEG